MSYANMLATNLYKSTFSLVVTEVLNLSGFTILRNTGHDGGEVQSCGKWSYKINFS